MACLKCFSIGIDFFQSLGLQGLGGTRKSFPRTLGGGGGLGAGTVVASRASRPGALPLRRKEHSWKVLSPKWGAEDLEGGNRVLVIGF